MLLKTINFVRGNVRIEIRGAATERFLNMCAQKDVAFWDIHRVSEDTVRATVRVSGFFQLRHFARRCMCRIHVVKKQGMPFVVHKYSKRYALWGGALVCCAAIWALSGFIWTIEITGCETVSEVEIAQMLQENGLKTGVMSSKIDPKEIKNNIMMQTDKLSFIAVNLKGSHAEVVVRESTPKPKMVPQDEPCDVVSDKTGVITKLSVKRGIAQTAVGNTVTPGEKLASGSMVSTQEEYWQVHAEAEAELQTWHTLKTKLPREVYGLRETGNVKKKLFLVVGERRIPLSIVESEPFACYDKKTERKQLALGDNMRLPVALVTETYTEVTKAELELDEQKCGETLKQRMLDSFALLYPEAQIVKEDFALGNIAGAFEGTLKIEARETTGVQVPLAVTEGQNGETNDGTSD